MARAAPIGTHARVQVELRVSLAILALVAVLPAVIENEYWRGVLIVSMYFALLAVAWNLLAGYTGQFSLAPATFGMLGAYTTGLLAYHLGLPPLAGFQRPFPWPDSSDSCSAALCYACADRILRIDHAFVRRDHADRDQQLDRDHARSLASASPD